MDQGSGGAMGFLKRFRFSVKKVILGLMLLVFLLGSGIGIGLWVANERTIQFSLLARAERKVSAYLRSTFASEDSSFEEVRTNRLALTKRVYNVPMAVNDSGGGIAEAPGGGLLLLDHKGVVFHIDDEKTVRLDITTPDNGVEDLQNHYESGEFGSQTFDERRFRFNDILAVPRNGQVELFISFSDWVPERTCYRSILAKTSVLQGQQVADWKIARDDWQEVYVTEPCLPPLDEGGTAIQGIEAGGRLTAFSQENILWSVGAYEHDDFFKETGRTPYAQGDESDYGRLLSFDLESGETRVLARGLRNPQGIATFSDGRAVATDHGMQGGDELNLVEPERPEYNFGWPYVSYGTHYGGGIGRPVHASGTHRGHEGYDLPLVAFVPSIAPSAVVAIENFHPVWNGDILVGSFRGDLERVHLEDGRVAFVETIPLGARVRDMELTSGGEIVVWTDDLQLIFLSPSKKADPAEVLASSLKNFAPPDGLEPAQDLLETCLQCHGLAKGAVLAGPSLYGICEARVASAEGYDQYSLALSTKGGSWNADLLAAFIIDPQSVVPGTSMAWGGTNDEQSAKAVADALCAQSTD